MAEQQQPNGHLRLIEAGIDLAQQSDNAHQREQWDSDADGNVVENRVAQLLHDDRSIMNIRTHFDNKQL